MRAGINAVTAALVVGVLIGLALTPDGRGWLRRPTLMLGGAANASAGPEPIAIVIESVACVITFPEQIVSFTATLTAGSESPAGVSPGCAVKHNTGTTGAVMVTEPIAEVIPVADAVTV